MAEHQTSPAPLAYVYKVVGLAKQELNGREVKLIVPSDCPYLIFLRTEPRHNG